MLAALLQAAADPKIVKDFADQVPRITESLSGYAPEVALAGLACLILLVDLLLPLRVSRAEYIRRAIERMNLYLLKPFNIGRLS